MALAKMPCIYSCSSFCARTKTSWAESSLTRDSGFPISDDAGTSGGGNTGVTFRGDVAASGGNTSDWHGATTTKGIYDKIAGVGQSLNKIPELLHTLSHPVMLFVTFSKDHVREKWMRRNRWRWPFHEEQDGLELVGDFPGQDAASRGVHRSEEHTSALQSPMYL